MKQWLHYASLIFLIIVLPLGLWLLNGKDPYPTKPPPPLPRPPIKELAASRGLQVGSFAALKYLRERPYREILASQFEYFIIDGDPNWKFEDFTLRPTKNTYDFRHLDQVLEFADEEDKPVRIQHLIWGDDKWLPDWLTKGNFTQAQLLQIIHDHIRTVAGRYKGRVREYTVVNEAFSRKLVTFGNHDWWGERLGTTYIDDSFIWAHQADPKAKLILNDFGNETEGDISNIMYDYVKGATRRGVPIDGIGMQMHIDGSNPPDKEKVVANMRRFRNLGVRTYVTEFDVSMEGVHKSKQDEDQLQAQIYKNMVGACLEAGPDTCVSLGFLGLTDRQTWYKAIGQTQANPLMFTDNYTPKPAFFAVREALQANN
jgi:endo-1,4-beta-xylanase